MAIIIIQAGTPPSEKPIFAVCNSCWTHFTFGLSDALRISDQRDGDFYSIRCPLDGCGKIVAVGVKSGSSK